MKRLILVLAVALGSLLTLSGCVEWERQTVTYRYHPDRDELRMLIVYDGVYSAGSLSSGIDQLRTVLARPRAFFFDNWISEYDRDAWVRLASEPAAEDMPEDLADAMEAVVDHMLDDVRVMNGAFYLNGNNELAAYQRLTLTHVSEFVAAVNTLVNAAVVHGEVDAGDFGFSADYSDTLLRDAAWSGHEWLTLDAGEFSLHVPVTFDDYVAMLEASSETGLAWLRDAGVGISHASSTLAVRLPASGGSHSTLSLPVFPRAYKPNLVEFVEDEALMSPRPDLEALSRRFVDAAM